MRRTASVVVGAMLVVGFGALGPAQAALTTHCNGTAGAVTVPGDLVVPAGKACNLDGTTIDGNVRVAAGADLVGSGITVNGNVTVQGDGYLDLTDSEVSGNVNNRGAYGVYLDGSSLNAYSGTEANPDTFLTADGSHFGGRVAVAGGSLLLEGAVVDRVVTVSDAYYADILDTVVQGALTVSGNEYGSMVCGSEVDGHASFTGNSFGVQLGAGGALGVCDQGPSVWGGDLTVSDTAGHVQVSDNIIRGNLAGTGNASVSASDNRVRGELQGQFSANAPAARAMARMQQQDTAQAEEARDVVERLRAERAAAAEWQAAKAGPAGL